MAAARGVDPLGLPSGAWTPLSEDGWVTIRSGLPDRLMVGHRILVPIVGVRVPVGQPKPPRARIG